MNKEQLYNRGQRSIADGIFIRDRVIPLALENKHWNIVVFESYRVIELLIKGMICVSGYTPRETHEIDSLVERFSVILHNAKKSLPFTYTLFGIRGNCYGVTVKGGVIELFRRNSEIYTQLARIPFRELAVDELLRMKLEYSGTTLTLYVNDQELIRHTDSGVLNAKRFERGFVKNPDKLRLSDLKHAVKELRAHRESAFYSTRVYLEEDAHRAISFMEIASEASKTFVVLDVQ